MKHKIIKRYRTTQSMDCEGWHNDCSCGEELFGWTMAEVEEEAEKHLKLNKK